MGIVKLCGFTRREDLAAARSLEADRCGIVIDYPPSLRSLSLADAVFLVDGDSTAATAVTVNPSLDLIDRISEQMPGAGVQLSGEESPDFVTAVRSRHPGLEIWKVLRLAETEAALVKSIADYSMAGATQILMDSGTAAEPGGTGKAADLEKFAALRLRAGRQLLLAGGLTPETVEDAVHRTGADGVDVSTGVESAPGVKDVAKMQLFVKGARAGFLRRSVSPVEARRQDSRRRVR